jgi:hypothetical protein
MGTIHALNIGDAGVAQTSLMELGKEDFYLLFREWMGYHLGLADGNDSNPFPQLRQLSPTASV